MTVETDPQAVHRAVLVLEEALEQEYPGEFLDPDALAVVLARLAELEAMERRAHTVADYAITEERRQVGRFILTGEDGN